MRPEHFEDAGVAEERGIQGMKFTADVAVVESMGSELYAYFDVKGAAHSDHLDALADDAGLSELPGQSGGDATAVVARLDADQPGGGRQVDRARARRVADPAVRPERRPQPDAHRRPEGRRAEPPSLPVPAAGPRAGRRCLLLP